MTSVAAQVQHDIIGSMLPASMILRLALSHSLRLVLQHLNFLPYQTTIWPVVLLSAIFEKHHEAFAAKAPAVGLHFVINLHSSVTSRKSQHAMHQRVENER